VARENDEKILISVIKQYYELGMSQEEIAAKEYISKSTISRMIKKAEKKGYVDIRVKYPILTVKELERKLKDYFDLHSATVVPVYVDDYELCVMDVCKMLLADLKRVVTDGHVVGLSWGRTMEYLARLMDDYKNNKKNVTFVQLNGNVASNILSVKSYNVVEKFQRAFSADGYLFPLPILVDDEQTARALMNDSRIRPVMDIARRADTVILGIGRMDRKSLVFERGALSEADYKELKAAGAVGDVCSRYFNEQGEIADRQLDSRVLGLTLEELRAIPHRMVIAVGEEKTRAVVGALRTGIVGDLYIDEKLAARIISQMEA